jgi:hypothetical protein
MYAQLNNSGVSFSKTVRLTEDCTEHKTCVYVSLKRLIATFFVPVNDTLQVTFDAWHTDTCRS